MKPATLVLLMTALTVLPMASAIPFVEPPPSGFPVEEGPNWCPFGYSPNAFVNLCLTAGGEGPGNFYLGGINIIGNLTVPYPRFDEGSAFSSPLGIYADALCNIGEPCGCFAVGPDVPPYDPLLKICAPIFA